MKYLTDYFNDERPIGFAYRSQIYHDVYDKMKEYEYMGIDYIPTNTVYYNVKNTLNNILDNITDEI